jgi:hypothetical protein
MRDWWMYAVLQAITISPFVLVPIAASKEEKSMSLNDRAKVKTKPTK